jgi:hypothetical protein
LELAFEERVVRDELVLRRVFLLRLLGKIRPPYHLDYDGHVTNWGPIQDLMASEI